MSEILDLCRGLETADFAPGDVLLQDGEKSGNLYILIKGRLETRKGGSVLSSTREPGAVFGEISVLLDGPHTATVAAVEPTSCYVSRGGRAFLAANPELSLFVAELLARRLQGMNRYLVDMKAQYEDRKDHLGMVDQVLEALSHRQPKRA
jgi:CRP-like cAMP-binding protein